MYKEKIKSFRLKNRCSCLHIMNKFIASKPLRMVREDTHQGGGAIHNLVDHYEWLFFYNHRSIQFR